jgi:hypothetical protein
MEEEMEVERQIQENPDRMAELQDRFNEILEPEEKETRTSLCYLLGACPRLERLNLANWWPWDILAPESQQIRVFTNLPPTLRELVLGEFGEMEMQWHRHTTPFYDGWNLNCTVMSGPDLELVGRRCPRLEELAFAVSDSRKLRK